MTGAAPSYSNVRHARPTSQLENCKGTTRWSTKVWHPKKDFQTRRLADEESSCRFELQELLSSNSPLQVQIALHKGVDAIESRQRRGCLSADRQGDQCP